MGFICTSVGHTWATCKPPTHIAAKAGNNQQVTWM